MVKFAAAATTAIAVMTLLHARTARPRPMRSRVRRAQWLAESGWRWGAGRFALLRIALALLAFVLAWELTAAAAVALPPAAVAGMAPAVLLRRRRARRRAELATAWPDGLRDVSAAVAAGLSLPQALLGLCHTGPAALQDAFARFPMLLPALGFSAALERVRAQAADPTTDRVVEVLLLAHERGGRILPTLLNDLAESTARESRLAERLVTAQLELRINARAVFALPWLVLLVLCAREGPFRAYYASPRGITVVALGAALSLAGVALVERLGRVPIEPRVFTGSAATPGGRQ